MQVIFCIGPVQDMIDVNEKALWPPARPVLQRWIKTRTVNVFKDPSTLLGISTFMYVWSLRIYGICHTSSFY